MIKQIEIPAGLSFRAAVYLVKMSAKTYSLMYGGMFYFYFNGIICFVSEYSNIEKLERDYNAALILGWDRIGPDTVDEYDETTKKEIKEKKKEREERISKEVTKDIEERKSKKQELLNEIENYEIKLKDKKGWNAKKSATNDFYERGVIEYAENWAKLMQKEMNNGKSLDECAKETGQRAIIDGISGFMHNSAKRLLEKYWKYGDKLKEIET